MEYFTILKGHIRFQARWTEFLSEFDFVIKYQLGNKNRKPHTLSRHWDLRSEEGSGDLQPVHFLFKPDQFQISAMKATNVHNPFHNIFISTGKKNESCLAIRDTVATKKEGLDPHFNM